MDTLKELQADVGSRLRVLRDEAARVAANTNLAEADKRRIVAEKYGALMAPVISALDKHAREVGVAASTPHEQAYAKGTAAALRAAIAVFRSPDASAGEAAGKAPSHQRCWAPMQEIQREIAKQQRSLALSLPRISPHLAALTATSIPMPGLASEPAQLPATAAAAATAFAASPAAAASGAAEKLGAAREAASGGSVCIDGFGDDVQVLPTKTKPKKLGLRGDDGREYAYLLKGRGVGVDTCGLGLLVSPTTAPRGPARRLSVGRPGASRWPRPPPQ